MTPPAANVVPVPEIRRFPTGENSKILILNGAERVTCPVCDGEPLDGIINNPNRDIYRLPFNDPRVWVVRPNGYFFETRGRLPESIAVNEGDQISAYGVEELVIFPKSNDPEGIFYLLQAYASRVKLLESDPDLRYTILSRNLHDYGEGHRHARLISSSDIPGRILEELESAKKFYDWKERCIHCEDIADVTNGSSRQVKENDLAEASVPFAPDRDHEVNFRAKRHTAYFGELNEDELYAMAELMADVMGTFSKHFGSFGMYTHDGPRLNGHSSTQLYNHAQWYHPHIVIFAGCLDDELPGGWQTIAKRPEDSAKEIRELLRE